MFCLQIKEVSDGAKTEDHGHETNGRVAERRDSSSTTGDEDDHLLSESEHCEGSVAIGTGHPGNTSPIESDNP